MKKISLQRKLFFLIIALGVFFSVVIGVGLYLFLQNKLVDQRVSEVTHLAVEQSHETNAQFRVYQAVVRTLAVDSKTVDFLLQPSETQRVAMDTRLNRFIQDDKNILSAYVMDGAGLTLVSTDKRFVGNNYGFRDYFKGAMLSEAVVDASVGVTSNQFGYYFSYPVRSVEGTVIGVMVIKVGSNYFDAALYSGELANHNKFMLVDKIGVVVSSNKTERFLHSLGPLSEVEQALIKSSNRFAGRRIDPLQYGFIKGVLDAYSVPTVLSFADPLDNGDQETIHVLKVPDVPFFLVTEINVEEIYSSVLVFIGLLGLYLFVTFVVIAFVLFSFFRSTVLNPLQLLKATSLKMSNGIFSAPIRITSGDEIEDLAGAFNQMSKKLEGYYDELHADVKKKVVALSQKSEDLRSQQAAILNLLEDAQMEKEASGRLAEDLMKFKLALDSASDVIIITDVNGSILYANKSVEKDTGYTVEEILQKDISTLWRKSMTVTVKKRLLEDVVSKKEKVEVETVNSRKSGELYTVEISAAPILDEAKNVKFLLSIEHDISERKAAEEQIQKVLNDLQEKSYVLASEKAQSEALFENIGDGIIATDRHGIVTAMNDAALSMIGFARAEIVGKPAVDTFFLVDTKDATIPLSERPMTLALSIGKKIKTPVGKVYYVTRKDGKKFPVNFTLSPLILEGKVIGVVGVFRDVTFEMDVDRMKTEFVSLASHQLRTPLSAVSWYAEMLIAGDAGKLLPEQLNFVEEIYKDNKRMVELVNALLNVSRIEMGTFAVDPKDVDVAETAQSVIDELKPIIIQKQMNVVLNADKTIKTMKLDPSLFRIVLQNFLTNAVKYTPDKGNVSVTVKKRKDDVLFSIADSGYGIPKKDQDKIFTKMFRADNVKIKDTSGTGLGLYIVRSIIEQTTNGKVWFESEENKGTTFYFTLPSTGMAKKQGSKALT